MRSVLFALMVGVSTLNPRLDAQSIVLRIKPHTGDTIRMRLDQQSEMTGTRRTPGGDATSMVLTTMKMFSRALVEGASEQGTTILAVTDSVQVSTTDERSRADVPR